MTEEIKAAKKFCQGLEKQLHTAFEHGKIAGKAEMKKTRTIKRISAIEKKIDDLTDLIIRIDCILEIQISRIEDIEEIIRGKE